MMKMVEFLLPVDGRFPRARSWMRSILDALEAPYPVLKGTLRDQTTRERRPFIRFFACGQDFSLDAQDTLLPEAVASGRELFRIVGAMAGG